ncbi:MAG: M1 family metallopeptidase [Gemmatimonadota bacterium]
MRRALLAPLLGALTIAGPAAAQQHGIDVVSYHFTVTLDTAPGIRVAATVGFRRGPGAGARLLLDLVGMTVDSIVNSVTVARVPFEYDGRRLSIPITSEREQRVIVTYHGIPGGGLIARATARGRPSVFGDNWPERARYWLASVDHPSDKATISWLVENIPRGWRVVANGVCRPVPRRPAVRCVERRPIPTYTMVLGATSFAVSTHRPVVNGRDTIPIEVWAYPEDSAFADSVPFRRATLIVETMQRIVGPYPYEKLAHVQSSTRFGGMENASAIFYAESAYVTRRLGEGTVRHETAHQWFGDAVTERDWHDLWLSEGFASYFDGVIGAALDGDSVLARIMRDNAASYLRSRVVDRPLVDTTVTDPNDLLNANSYQKGAWVLHMLRGLVGDSAFFSGVRDYYRIYRDSTATSEDFRRVMERAAGGSLDWFFQQWLHQPGYPQLDIRWVNDSTSRQVVLHVRQAQPAAWGRFRLAVPIRFVGVEGIAWRTLNLDPRYQDQVASFTVDRMPAAILIDPSGTLLLTATVHR